MTHKNLISLSITEALHGLKEKHFSAVELMDAHLAQMDACDHLNAFITKTPDDARKHAAESDARIAKGDMRPLEGIPFAMKDLFCTKGVRTTAASHILENFVPAYESTVSQKLLDAGTINVGKANLDEFAMGGANITSYFGPVENPWKSSKYPENVWWPVDHPVDLRLRLRPAWRWARPVRIPAVPHANPEVSVALSG